jgi:hypothetical protein
MVTIPGKTAFSFPGVFCFSVFSRISYSGGRNLSGEPIGKEKEKQNRLHQPLLYNPGMV